MADPRMTRRHTLHLAGAALASLVTGCTTGNRGVVSPVGVPDSFSGGGSVPLAGAWWRAFQDSTLNGLVRDALAGNQQTQATAARLDQARAVARREGADLLPSLTARGSWARTREVTANPDTVSTSSRASASLVSSWEIDLWGRVRAGRDAAGYDAAATAEELRRAVEVTLPADVATAWVQLIEQYGQIDLLSEQAKTNRQVEELTNTRFQKGKAGAADVLRQRQLVESSRGNVATAEARAGVLEHSLAVLLGRPPGERPAPRTAKLPDLPPLPATGVPAELIQRRPDLRQAFYQILAADRRLAAAKAERFPQLSLSPEVGTSAPRIRSLFDNWLATLAGNLTAPLVDGGFRRAEVERTRALVEERVHTYGQRILEALQEVEDALVQERQQRVYLESLTLQITLAEQTLERTRDGYSKGSGDYLRVLDSLSSLQNLQRTRLTARRQLLEYRISLCRALAGGWK